ncbi:MAG TPA: nucleotidyltransferase family protein [Syntrophorhabdaceae bacterium]|nr:nucleotidyltransferase family protein [Syntrophorhabdaceae bacterium]
MDRKNFSGHGIRVRASTAELRLLIRILSKDTAGAARCLENHPGLMNMLAETCNRTGLSVVLLRALEGSPLQSAIMPQRIGYLRAAVQVQRERLQALMPALASLVELFDSAKQPFILLKGPYLARRYYGDIMGREYVDIDLLVPVQNRSKVCALLKSAGYHRQSGILLSEGLTGLFVHAFDFRSGTVGIDLHWNLSQHISLHLNEEQWWTQRVSFSIDGKSYEVLSDRHEVTFAALSLLRDIERGRPKPKNIIDLMQIAVATDVHMDWEDMLSARDGTAGPVEYVLRRCLEITDACDLVPNLSASLNRRQRIRVPQSSITDSPLQFPPAFLGLGNKLRVATAYETNPATWLFWWGLSLPFRLAAHKKPPLRSGQRKRRRA